MDELRRLQASLHSPEARQRRQARRARRQSQVYSQIRDALGSTEGNFSSRVADMWSLNSEETSTRKIRGNAGAEAAMYVSETFGSFDVRGSVRARYAGMEREAGFGGHGITDGVITIDVEVKPIKGMLQVFEVPVQVKQGRMLQPGLFYHQGVPYVIAQSSIDEVLSAADYGGPVKTDRKTLFSPPKNSNGRQAQVKPPSWADMTEQFTEADTGGGYESVLGVVIYPDYDYHKRKSNGFLVEYRDGYSDGPEVEGHSGPYPSVAAAEPAARALCEKFNTNEVWLEDQNGLARRHPLHSLNEMTLGDPKEDQRIRNEQEYQWNRIPPSVRRTMTPPWES